MRRETECMSELFNQRVLEASDAHIKMGCGPR